MRKGISLRVASVASLFVVIAMLVLTVPAFAQGGGGGGGGGGSGHHFALTQASPDLQAYAVDGNVKGVHGRVVISTPPPRSGEPHAIHVVGLTGLISHTYYVWFRYADGSYHPAYNTASTNSLVYTEGKETEFSAAIPSNITTPYQVYISASPNPGSVLLLKTGNISLK